MVLSRSRQLFYLKILFREPPAKVKIYDELRIFGKTIEKIRFLYI